jgi:hypothetical protein
MRRRSSAVHSPGLLYRFFRTLRGSETTLVRPAEPFPLVTIACLKDDQEGALELKAALEETWLTLPAELKEQYLPVLRRMPPMIVVEVRRRNPCTCLGHCHPAGTESRLARHIRDLSGVQVGELDLATEAIREWQPAPLAGLAASAAAGPEAEEELQLFRYRLALLDVLLHELHHLAAPDAREAEVRGQSGQFYEQALDAFMRQRFGSSYGLRGSA